MLNENTDRAKKKEEKIAGCRRPNRPGSMCSPQERHIDSLRFEVFMRSQIKDRK